MNQYGSQEQPNTTGAPYESPDFRRTIRAVTTPVLGATVDLIDLNASTPFTYSSTQGERPKVLTGELHDTLLEYLRFRHVFRSAYAFDLDWQKMSPLVLRVEKTFSGLENALDTFLATGSRGIGKQFRRYQKSRMPLLVKADDAEILFYSNIELPDGHNPVLIDCFGEIAVLLESLQGVSCCG